MTIISLIGLISFAITEKGMAGEFEVISKEEKDTRQELNTGSEEKFKTYVNERFGFSLSYPHYLKPAPTPQNGAGMSFHADDDSLSVSAQAHFLHENTLSTMWNDALKAYGKSVTYKVKRNNWFVVSGVDNGTEYYHKLFVKGKNWVSFTITYPHSQRQKFDPIVGQIAKRFIPFLEGDYDRIP